MAQPPVRIGKLKLRGIWRGVPGYNGPQFRSTRAYDAGTVAPAVDDQLDFYVDAEAIPDIDAIGDDTQPIDAAAVVADVLDVADSADTAPDADAAGDEAQPIDVAVVEADQPDPDAALDASQDADADSVSEALAAEDTAPDTLDAADADAALDDAAGDDALTIDAVVVVAEQLDVDASADAAVDDAADSQSMDVLADDLAAIDLEYPELEMLAEVEPDLWFEAGALDNPPAGIVDDQEYQVITHEEAEPAEPTAPTPEAGDPLVTAPSTGHLSDGVKVVRNQYLRRSWNPKKEAYTKVVSNEVDGVTVQSQVAVMPDEEDEDEALAALMMF